MKDACASVKVYVILWMVFTVVWVLDSNENLSVLFLSHFKDCLPDNKTRWNFDWISISPLTVSKNNNDEHSMSFDAINTEPQIKTTNNT